MLLVGGDQVEYYLQGLGGGGEGALLCVLHFGVVCCSGR